MELAIRNKWITIRGSSVVKDLNENDVLKVQGKFWTFTRKKFVKELDDTLLFTVRNKFWAFFVKKAYVYDKDGNVVANIRRKFFSLHDRYFIDSTYGNFEIKGNILQFNYQILLNGKEVGHIARKISLRDSFVLTINEEEIDYKFMVALVIAIDNITDQREQENSSSFSSDY